MVKKTAKLMGVGIGSGSLLQIVQSSLEKIDQQHSPTLFVCANPHSLVIARRDHEFMNALNNAEYSVADGVGVTMGAKLLSKDVGPRIAGHDYFIAMMSSLEQRGGGRVFFFGSSDHVLSLIQKRFENDFPKITLCGMLSPPYGDWSDEENDRMIAQINKADPDVLWVGMTAPKQEKWSEANRLKLNARIVGSIGAVFDFYAGTYLRAPLWASRIGIEWLYRLIKEPKRMWRRNFISSPLFLLAVLKEKLS